MALFALSDLHLSLGTDKPMDVFGASWHNYVNRIRENWIKTVRCNDLVIIGGDVSWATYLNEAKKDFEFVNSLPGKKLIIKGNHDYWWESITKLNKSLADWGFDSISFLHNDFFTYENFSIGAARGWIVPKSDNFKKEDEKIYERELIRLSLSFDKMEKAQTQCEENETVRIAVFHFPPVNSLGECDEKILELLKKYNVKKCIYGHLHGEGIKTSFNGNAQGIDFYLTSADYLGFTPLRIK